MKVFISWSGDRSKEMAKALRDWLPMALNYVEPFVSDKDIQAGDRWAQKIAGELESANFGIICITPENISSEWILFESGALSKSMLDGKVIPLLFDLELSDLTGPLSQFQAQKLEASGIMEVVKSINEIAEKKTADDIIARSVPALWPQLETALTEIPSIAPTAKHRRPTPEILEELVTDVRGLNSRMRGFDPELFERERFMRSRKFRFHPMMFEELAHMSGDPDDGPIALVAMAGMVRDDMPWLAEMLTEAYREVRDSGPEKAERALHRIRRSIKHMSHSKMSRELMGGSKERMMMMEELPMLLDMALHRISDRAEAKESNFSDEDDPLE
ncbi:toll/interleukin-1 receptor domain-containing protein [Shimia haliotis]|uniref:TIR domain-containing protein n=1 Tax=Shimia haliotis TaxID=1280847 RepID=A0A1I4GBH8_9RHOB|nr:toll/interleukin-1 receptor domain-containing protein [Shimia haliotis]SFL26870.1 TIR domain-containing protein [Shimia haliotis]